MPRPTYQGKSGELDEQELRRQIARTRAVVEDRAAQRNGFYGRPDVDAVASAFSGRGGVDLPKGPHHAIFGRGSGINRQRHTGIVIVLIHESILYGGVAVPERLIAETTMDR